MRLYLVSTRYSMGIQAGIQAMHAIPELYEKFLNTDVWDSKFLATLREWAQKHKTIMHLRTFGGNDSIEELYETVSKPARALKLPYALFREAELRNSATSVGVVVPTSYYETPFEELSPELQELKAALDRFPFAS